MGTEPKEPLLGEELIRLQIEGYYAHFVFSTTALQIGADVSVTSSLATRRGDLSAIWRLIGDRVATAIWGDAVVILFESGRAITIPPPRGQIRGSILGRAKNEDGSILFEDF